MAERPVHKLMAHWRSACGLELLGPLVEPVQQPDDERTLAKDYHGRILTWVPVDVSCGRCQRSVRVIHPGIKFERER